MSVAIIINPIAGARGRSASSGDCVELARRVAQESGQHADVFVTERPGHARELARTAGGSGATLVIAWGGDGTVNEVASALAFGDVPLGVVADGSGNGLARCLGIVGDPAEALRRAIRAEPRAIDVGEIDGRLFVNLAGIGFDAYIASRFNAPDNPKRGLATYALLTMRGLLEYESRSYDVITPESRTTVRALLVLVANGTEFGNRIRIAPQARLDDGALDLVVVEEQSRAKTIWNLPRLFVGAVERSPIWSARLVQRVTIESEHAMVFHVDGEPVMGGTRLDARIHPAALKICSR